MIDENVSMTIILSMIVGGVLLVAPYALQMVQ